MLLKIVAALVLLVAAVHGQREGRASHKSKLLTNNEFKQLASLTDETYFKHVLENILVPRVVGTPGHEKVKDFIAREMSSLGWLVSLHSFKAATPIFGPLTFTNVIAELSPFNHTRQLSLACHYDSKYFEEFTFYAATDSAVPCAMLIHLAKVLTPYLNPQDIGVKLIFFDGEEAFHQWTKSDSLYGSRQLAEKWEKEPFPHKSRSDYSQLDRMDMLVLLDLIGTKDQQFYSYFGTTERWHRLLSKIEKQLKVMKVIPSSQPLHFLEKSIRAGIEDDHVPFLKREVPVLHLIPPIFPSVWHTAGDNYDVLDFPTINTLNKVLQVFVYVYVH